jgi:hypothetical protein
LIPAAVAEFEFELFTAIRQTEQLVTQADPKNRAPADQSLQLAA